MASPCTKSKKISGSRSAMGRKTGKQKKSKTKMATSKRSSKEGSSVYDEQMDMSKPLFPLSHYTNDRTQLVDQVFMTMSRKGQLEAILPDILKDLPLSELKQLCVQQLEVMSKKRIKRLLLGEDMESSSGTDEESENELECQQSGTASPQVADSTGMELVDDERNQNCVKLSEEAIECLELGELPSTDMLELHPDSDGEDTLLTDPGGSESDDETDVIVSTPLTVQNIPLSAGSSTIAKTCLEILELELRARAIKSLLKTHPVPTNFDS